jgi:hypothetical protein
VEKLPLVTLKKIVFESAAALSIDECFVTEVRESFKNFILEDAELQLFWNEIEEIIEDVNGDAEKFQSCIFSISVNGTMPFYANIGRVKGNLLMAEVGNCILYHLSHVESDRHIQPLLEIEPNELFGIQYLAGYTFRKVYSKMRRSSSARSEFHQQCCHVLEAAKSEHVDDQRLIKAKDRGGLWIINEFGVQILFCAEKVFRQNTSSFIVKIDYIMLVEETVKNPTVLSNFEMICSGAAVDIDPDIANELLRSILGLYFRVRSHSYAKDIREKYKHRNTVMKRSLRTTLKISDGGTDVKGH